MKTKEGQFWRDTVNGDILKLLTFSVETLEDGRQVEYVRCGCYVRNSTDNDDRVMFGVQEMKTERLDGQRFKKLGIVKSYFLRRKLQPK